jgi:hypothetical protein
MSTTSALLLTLVTLVASITLFPARPSRAAALDLGVSHTHTFRLDAPELALGERDYQQTIGLFGGLGLGAGVSLEARLGLLAAFAVPEGSYPGSAGLLLGDLRFGARWAPRALRIAWLDVAPVFALDIVAPTSAFSQAAGMVLGLAPGVELGRRFELGAGRWLRHLDLRLVYRGYRFFHEEDRAGRWLGEVNVFTDLEHFAGPAVLTNYHLHNSRTAWHLNAALLARCHLFAGLSLAAGLQLFTDQVFYDTTPRGGTLFGTGLQTVIPAGVRIANLTKDAEWDSALFVSAEFAYQALPWLAVSAGVSHRQRRLYHGFVYAAASPDPAAPLVTHGPYGSSETRAFLSVALAARSDR